MICIFAKFFLVNWIVSTTIIHFDHSSRIVNWQFHAGISRPNVGGDRCAVYWANDHINYIMMHHFTDLLLAFWRFVFCLVCSLRGLVRLAVWCSERHRQLTESALLNFARNSCARLCLVSFWFVSNSEKHVFGICIWFLSQHVQFILFPFNQSVKIDYVRLAVRIGLNCSSHMIESRNVWSLFYHEIHYSNST